MESRQRKHQSDDKGLEELNLVEIPLAILADRPPGGLKTLEVSDQVWDEAAGRHVQRQWTITGADKWGLPAGYDMDLILALEKLTKDKGCVRRGDGKVPFSLYELRNELRWPHDGRNNNRLKKGLERILGVTIECVNSWRKGGRWVSLDAFHLIERVKLTNTVAKFDPDDEQVFKWSDVVLESLKAGHTKELDWNFYMGLESAISKRLYRFLDKRWALGSRWSYDLIPFCENKMGMRQARKTNYRGSLAVGIDELTRKGVLQRTDESKMFVGRGKLMRVNFARARQGTKRIVRRSAGPEPNGLERKLVSLGINAGCENETSAGSLVRDYPDEKVALCVEHFKELNVRAKTAAEKKGIGFLVSSIRSDNARGFVPDDFKSKAERERECKAKAEQKRKQEEARRREDQQRASDTKAEENRLDEALATIAAEDLGDVEKKALAAAQPLMASLYRKAQAPGMREIYRRQILRNYLLPTSK